jgi:glutaminyl-tRNA synthetase
LHLRPGHARRRLARWTARQIDDPLGLGAARIPAEIRLYDRLFTVENPDSDSFKEYLNPNSLEVLAAYVEPGMANAESGFRLQFERQGYFCVDQDTTPEKLVINRTVPLKDTWAKIEKKQG